MTAHRIGALAMLALAVAILVAGVAFALSRASALVEPEQALTSIHRAGAWWVVAHAAFLVMALLLILSLPGLRALVAPDREAYGLIGTYLALASAGPLVVAAVLALAFMPLGAEYVGGQAREAALVAARGFQVAERAAFMMVGAFVGGTVGSFALALGGPGDRALRTVGLIGGILFAVGTLGPAVLPLFMVANVIGIGWFIALGVRVLRDSGRASGNSS